MKDPDIIEFLKGFNGKPPKETEKEWFRTKYKGLFPNWGDYEADNNKDKEQTSKRG